MDKGIPATETSVHNRQRDMYDPCLMCGGIRKPSSEGEGPGMQGNKWIKTTLAKHTAYYMMGTVLGSEAKETWPQISQNAKSS